MLEKTSTTKKRSCCVPFAAVLVMDAAELVRVHALEMQDLRGE